MRSKTYCHKNARKMLKFLYHVCDWHCLPQGKDEPIARDTDVLAEAIQKHGLDVEELSQELTLDGWTFFGSDTELAIKFCKGTLRCDGCKKPVTSRTYKSFRQANPGDIVHCPKCREE